MTHPRNELSVVSDSGGGISNNCGYCGGQNCFVTHGMPARKLTVYAYQDLIDQGWRRSGSYLYKPDLARSCCKTYTIRLDVQQFTLDKGQRRLLRKWRSLLQGDLPLREGPAGAAGNSRNAINSLEPLLPTDPQAATAAPTDPGAPPKPHRIAWGSPESPQPAKSAAASAAAAAIAASSEHQDHAEEAALQQLLAAAVQAGLAAGDIPSPPLALETAYLPPAIRRCTVKQRQVLPADVHFTSTVAFALSAAISRTAAPAASTPLGADTGARAAAEGVHGSGPQLPKPPKPLRRALPAPEGAMSAQVVAQVLARHFNTLVAAREALGYAYPADSGGVTNAAKDSREAGRSLSLSDSASVEHVSGQMPARGQGLGAYQLEAYAVNGHMNFSLRSLPLLREGGAKGSCGGAGGGSQMRSGETVGPEPESVGGLGSPCGSSLVAARRRTGKDDPAATADASGKASAAAPCLVAAAHHVAGDQRAACPVDLDLLVMPPGRLEIRMIPSQFVEEEYQLYKSYQVSQHGDKTWEVQRGSYTRFLVDSPLQYVGQDLDPTAPECGYGSFHQQYWLDGKLIAVGVVDVLPRCLSSVYLFWDVSQSDLALGRFSALQEILWVRRQVASCPALRYYYMGFYIHTCRKMRYKAEYRPSDLLCPVRKLWVRITPQLLTAIEQRAFVELAAEQGAVCLTNLAASQSSEAGSAEQRSAEEGSSATQQARCSGSGADMDNDLDDTLILMQGQAAAAGPVTLQVIRRCNYFTQRGLRMLEQAIREWRAVVGWTAPSLVYQL